MPEWVWADYEQQQQHFVDLSSCAVSVCFVYSNLVLLLLSGCVHLKTVPIMPLAEVGGRQFFSVQCLLGVPPVLGVVPHRYLPFFLRSLVQLHAALL